MAPSRKFGCFCIPPPFGYSLDYRMALLGDSFSETTIFAYRSHRLLLQHPQLSLCCSYKLLNIIKVAPIRRWPRGGNELCSRCTVDGCRRKSMFILLMHMPVISNSCTEVLVKDILFNLRSWDFLQKKHTRAPEQIASSSVSYIVHSSQHPWRSVVIDLQWGS